VTDDNDRGAADGNDAGGGGTGDPAATAVAEGGSATDDSGSGRDTFELVATILLAIAAIAIAWAGFQSAKWGGVQATNFSQAGAARTESVRFSTLSGQLSSVDVTTFLSWLNAVVADIDSGYIDAPEDSADYVPTPDTLSGFIFERFRDEFKPAVQAWLATSPFEDPDAPPVPFQMPEYQLAAADEAEALLAVAEQESSEAGEANQTSDNYVVSAVIFAAALFFAAMSSKLTKQRYKTAALGIAAVILLGTVIYVLTLPIEV
jgi:hypothetical protein